MTASPQLRREGFFPQVGQICTRVIDGLLFQTIFHFIFKSEEYTLLKEEISLGCRLRIIVGKKLVTRVEDKWGNFQPQPICGKYTVKKGYRFSRPQPGSH